MKIRVIEEYKCCYPKPVNFKKGEKIITGKQDDSFPGWIWIITEDQNQGWAPEQILRIYSNKEAETLADYSARELNTEKNDELNLIYSCCGWIWAENQSGETGWIPEKTVIPVIETLGTRKDFSEYADRPGVYALMQQREKICLVNEGGQWFIPGGGIEPGENSIECLKRELAEETGFVLHTAQFFKRIAEYVHTRKNELYYISGDYYIVNSFSENGIPEEPGTYPEWVELEEAIHLLHRPAQKKITELFLRQNV